MDPAQKLLEILETLYKVVNKKPESVGMKFLNESKLAIFLGVPLND